MDIHEIIRLLERPIKSSMWRCTTAPVPDIPSQEHTLV